MNEPSEASNIVNKGSVFDAVSSNSESEEDSESSEEELDPFKEFINKYLTEKE